MVDASGSINEIDPDGWTKVKAFIIDVTRRFTISQAETRVGLTIFSQDATDRPGFPGVQPNTVGFFYLTDYGNAAELEDAINRLMYFGSFTNTQAGLRVAYQTILEASRGDRPNVQNVAIVITDGASNVDVQNLPREAAALKNEAIVAAVGVTPNVNLDELEEIATSQDLVVLASDFSNLAARLDSIVSTVCDVVTAPPPPPGKLTGILLDKS